MEQTQQHPNATLYIKNIDWKIKKNLVKKALYTLFTRHGKVLDVIVLRHDTLRGQAFVIMNDIQAATNALISEQGFTFYNKDLIIEYAKQPSYRYHRNIANGQNKPQRQRKHVRNDQKRDNDGDDGDDVNETSATKRIKVEIQRDVGDSMKESDENIMKKETEQQQQQNQVYYQLPPSRILLVHDIPPDIMTSSDQLLRSLFEPYHGFMDVRLLTSQSKAIIEFQEESYATMAYQTLQRFTLTPTYQLQLSYGKE